MGVNVALMQHHWVDLLPTNYQASSSLIVYNVSQTLASEKYLSLANLSMCVWHEFKTKLRITLNPIVEHSKPCNVKFVEALVTIFS